MTLSERLAASKEESPVRSSYGDRECGCTWDSMPYVITCDRHDTEQLFNDAVRQLLSAPGTVNDLERVAEARSVLLELLEGRP